jgi:anaerobic ribonucleoside-triphosphate reductase activating protein
MTTLQISRVADASRVLGPGLRAVIWVRGCPLRCPGCIAPQDLPFTGGSTRTVAELADWLNGLPGEVTGVTFSGGEPMAQAGPLAELTGRIRATRDWSVMSFSGFTIEHLRRHGTADQRLLLSRLDILVDGPYQEARHLLTDRHQRPDQDRSAGIELQVGETGVQWIGVPPIPGFRDNFERAMTERGVELIDDEGES